MKNLYRMTVVVEFDVVVCAPDAEVAERAFRDKMVAGVRPERVTLGFTRRVVSAQVVETGEALTDSVADISVAF